MHLGLDIGTSGVKALLMDDDLRIVGQETAPLEVSRPHPGWSEQAPDDWVRACQAAIASVRRVHGDAFAKLQSIGLSGHMHGAVLVGADGRPLRPCILWNDSRSGAECAVLEGRADFRGITGNLVMAGFTAPKLEWVARHEPEIFAKIDRVLLPKDYVRLWLTGEYVAEMSDASGTLWLDVGARRWSAPLLQACGLEERHMPALIEGSEVSGRLRPALASEWGIDTVAVAGGGGDNAATACGMGTMAEGASFMSLGTSGVLFAATDRFAPNAQSAVHAFCHAVPDRWHQMGVILAASDSLGWLSQITGRNVPDLAALVSADVEMPSPVRFLPYLSGERTPHNDPDASGAFAGLRLGHGVGDLVQAVMEGVGFAFADCLSALAAAGTQVETSFAVGGGARSEAWLQIMANATGVTVLVPEGGDYGAALGAARLGLAAVSGDTSDAVFAPPVVAREVVPKARVVARYAEAFAEYRALYPAVQGARAAGG